MLKFLKKFRIIKSIKTKLEGYYWAQIIIFNIYNKRISKFKHNRYRNLFRIIKKQKCRRILEIGVFDGATAFKMIKTAKKYHSSKNIGYFGFDLFEEISEEEIAKEHSKKPLTISFIRNMLEKTGVNVQLYKGNTRDTLPRFINEEKIKNKQFDFILIDGGHSVETIANDWNNVKNLIVDDTIVIFDDYYITDHKEKVEWVGCNSLIHNLDKNLYEVSFLTPPDLFKTEWGILKIYMVRVKAKREGI